jgi:hypothetical protein
MADFNDSFIFYKSNHESTKALGAEDYQRFFVSVFDFIFYEKEPTGLNQFERIAFDSIVQQVLRDKAKWIDRCEKNRQAIEKRWNKPSKTTKQPIERTEGTELAIIFDKARKAYLGTKNGLKVSLNQFKRVCKNEGLKVMDEVRKLLPAIEAEKKHKQALKKSGNFCPAWANFSTWINQKRWTQELSIIEKKESISDKLSQLNTVNLIDFEQKRELLK